MSTVAMHLLQAASNPALLPAAIGARDVPGVQWPLEPIRADSELGDLIPA